MKKSYGLVTVALFLPLFIFGCEGVVKTMCGEYYCATAFEAHTGEKIVTSRVCYQKDNPKVAIVCTGETSATALENIVKAALPGAFLLGAAGIIDFETTTAVELPSF